MSPHLSLVQRNPSWLNWLFALFMALMLAATLAPTKAQAAPLAGTSIGNQATADYSDGSGIPRNVLSNTVSTIVQQVASLTLTSSQSQFAAPGATSTFLHTLTNTGNGADSFTLTANSTFAGSFNIGAISIFLDADGNGIADNATNLNGVVIGPLTAFTGTFRFIVQTNVPGGAVDGNSDQITLTAASVFTPATRAVNTDTINVTGNAAVNVVKTITPVVSGAPSNVTEYTVTLAYTNSGAANATNIALYDALPAGMVYSAGSGLWSGSGTALTDAVAGDPAGVEYSAASNVVFARVASLIPTGTGSVSFRVRFLATPLTAAGVYANTAKSCYFNNVANVPLACDPTAAFATALANVEGNGTNTNTVNFTVTQIARVTISDTGSVVPPANSDTDGLNDVALVASASQGGTVLFRSTVTNTGNAADSFAISTSLSTFPTGTTFQILQSDGATPLVGSVTPVLAVNGTYDVFIRALLPMICTGAPGNCASTAPYNVTVTAASVFNSAGLGSDVTVDRLASITAAVVDLRNNAPNTDGTGILTTATAGASAVITTNLVNAGATTTFTLKVNNTVGLGDNYNLSASTDPTFATTVLPAGWTVTFVADGGVGNCSSTTGGAITNTGAVLPAGVATICAQVSVPAGFVPGTYDLYFRASSPSTTAYDIKRDAVTVNPVRSITLSPASQASNVPVGQTVTYSHIIANAGNVVEGTAGGGACAAPGAGLSTVCLSTLMSGVTAGWSVVSVRWDRNNDGVLDAGDPVVTDLSQLTGGSGGASTAAGLDVGESARLFVTVQAAGASAGDVNTTTLRATTVGVINAIAAPPMVSSNDVSTLVAGQVTLAKLQALDANCDGVADGPFVNTNINALPGACIRYQVTATNSGGAGVTGLVLTDATPLNTTFHATVPAAITGVGNTIIAAPAGGGTGAVQASIPSLAGGASVVLTLGVRINP